MSVGTVNKNTGDRIPTAGNPLDKVGNLASLHTTAKNDAVSAINEVKDEQSNKADNDIVADAFNAVETYAEGDYCTYEGGLYKFKTAHEGAWDAADVDQIQIAGELSELKNTLASVENAVDAVTEYSYDTLALTGFGASFSLQKIGRIVFLTYNGDANNLPSGVISFSEILPEKYRPAATTQFYSISGFSVYQPTVMIRLYSTGIIDGYNYGSAITEATVCRYGTLSYIAKG